MWNTLPKLIKTMEETFGTQLTGRVVHVPAAPKTGVVRPQEGETVIDPEEQFNFRTGVEMFLYLTSFPHLRSAMLPVREHTKILDSATP